MNRRRKKSLAKKRSNVISHISFDRPVALLVTAAVLTILEKFVEPILRFFAFPITVLTLGLFSLVISAFVLYLAFKFVEGAYIDSSLFSLIFASIILSILSTIVLKVMP